MCSSIYSGIFEAIHMDECCRDVKTRTFSLDSIPQGDVCLDFHRRPYPKFYQYGRPYDSQVARPKSKVEVPVRLVGLPSQ